MMWAGGEGGWGTPALALGGGRGLTTQTRGPPFSRPGAGATGSTSPSTTHDDPQNSQKAMWRLFGRIPCFPTSLRMAVHRSVVGVGGWPATRRAPSRCSWSGPWWSVPAPGPRGPGGGGGGHRHTSTGAEPHFRQRQKPRTRPTGDHVRRASRRGGGGAAGVSHTPTPPKNPQSAIRTDEAHERPPPVALVVPLGGGHPGNARIISRRLTFHSALSVPPGMPPSGPGKCAARTPVKCGAVAWCTHSARVYRDAS